MNPREWINSLRAEGAARDIIKKGLENDLDQIRRKLETADINDVPSLQGEARFVRTLLRELESLNNG